VNDLKVYRLTAKLGPNVRRKTIYACDDFQATMTAIAKIMNSATKNEIWAKGRIRLSRNGWIIHEMPAK